MGVIFIQFTSVNPLFKGISVTVIGLLALLFALWVKKGLKQPLAGGFLVFTCVSVFIVLYGLFILVFQPQWWNLPY